MAGAAGMDVNEVAELVFPEMKNDGEWGGTKGWRCHGWVAELVFPEMKNDGVRVYVCVCVGWGDAKGGGG